MMAQRNRFFRRAIHFEFFEFWVKRLFREREIGIHLDRDARNPEIPAVMTPPVFPVRPCFICKGAEVRYFRRVSPVFEIAIGGAPAAILAPFAAAAVFLIIRIALYL